MTATATPPTRARDARAKRLAPFVAFDGEGVDIDGEHRYVQLCSSTGRYIEDVAGLSTYDCLTFLIRESQGSPRPIPIGFYFTYDVNMILRDLTRDELTQLWETGELTWRPDDDSTFAIEWIPTKLLSLHAEIGDVRGGCKLYDTSGFFQQSFVKALTAWGFGDREAIAEMKDRRAVFSVDELDAIRGYCLEECRLLVEMMDKVRAALHSVELRPRSWLGAGAIASALLAKNNVHEHLASRDPQPALDDAVMRAYFGGRTEVFRQGIFPAAESWDVNSAYPYAATMLPTELGDWRRVREYDPLEPWALWRVEWELDDDVLVAPFPYRTKRAITFPLAGAGFYHADEVAAAIELYGDERIRVTSGYRFIPESDVRPFAFLPDVYAHRQALKAAGDPAEKVLKLGINSVYGKLAQGNSRDGRRPKFQSYFWAGAITAATRARMLRAAALDPAAVVAIATDGIVFAPRGPRELAPAPGLGGWERTRYRDFFVAQPGMYYAIDRSTNAHVRHSRGFFTKEIDFPALRRLWLERGPVATMPCRSTRFVGLGAALVRKDFTVWRQWVEAERRVSLYLSPRKRYADEEPEASKQLRPPARIRAGLSDVYVPKRAVVELDPDAIEWIEGVEQPGRDF